MSRYELERGFINGRQNKHLLIRITYVQRTSEKTTCWLGQRNVVKLTIPFNEQCILSSLSNATAICHTIVVVCQTCKPSSLSTIFLVCLTPQPYFVSTKFNHIKASFVWYINSMMKFKPYYYYHLYLKVGTVQWYGVVTTISSSFETTKLTFKVFLIWSLAEKKCMVSV